MLSLGHGDMRAVVADNDDGLGIAAINSFYNTPERMAELTDAEWVDVCQTTA